MNIQGYALKTAHNVAKRVFELTESIGRRLYKTENLGGNWPRRRRERLREGFSVENFPGYYSSHNPRIEGELAEKRKAPSVGHMALVYERMVEQMGVEPTTYTMRTYRSSQLSYCPTKNVLVNIHRKRENSRGGPLFFQKKDWRR